MIIPVKVSRKGGPGSGNWGHAGRPGLIGGSGGVGTGGVVGRLPPGDVVRRDIIAEVDATRGTDWASKSGPRRMEYIKQRLVEKYGLTSEFADVRKDLRGWLEDPGSPGGRRLAAEMLGEVEARPVLLLNKTVNLYELDRIFGEYDTINVWRGGSLDVPDVASYTRDVDVAINFAERHVLNLPEYSGEDPLDFVHEYSVPVSDVWFDFKYTDVGGAWGESEVIALSRGADFVGKKSLIIPISIKGGPGSGNWGHAGRPGLRGGSGGAGVTLTFGGASKPVWSEDRQRVEVSAQKLIDSVGERGIGKGKSWHGREPSVYLAENPEVALGYVLERSTNFAGIEANSIVQGVVFEVRVPASEIGSLVPDTMVPGIIAGRVMSGENWRVPRDIPTSWITKFTVYELDVDKYLSFAADEKLDALVQVSSGVYQGGTKERAYVLYVPLFPKLEGGKSLMIPISIKDN